MAKPSLRELAEKQLANQPIVTRTDVQRVYGETILGLADFRHGLLLGRLSLCCNCAHFTFPAERDTLGYCVRFRDNAAPFAPFPCEGFKAGKDIPAPHLLPDPVGIRARGYVPP